MEFVSIFHTQSDTQKKKKDLVKIYNEKEKNVRLLGPILKSNKKIAENGKIKTLEHTTFKYYYWAALEKFVGRRIINDMNNQKKCLILW